jgi:hypothetical protein
MGAIRKIKERERRSGACFGISHVVTVKANVMVVSFRPEEVASVVNPEESRDRVEDKWDQEFWPLSCGPRGAAICQKCDEESQVQGRVRRVISPRSAIIALSDAIRITFGFVWSDETGEIAFSQFGHSVLARFRRVGSRNILSSCRSQLTFHFYNSFFAANRFSN